MEQTAAVSRSDKSVIRRRIYDLVFLAGYLCCLVPGPFPGLTTIASLGLLLCIAVSFFDENFYLYAALFIYLRYQMLLGDSPAYRLYSYLLVLRVLIDLPKMKFHMVGIPALFVFLMHSIFAVGRFESMRIGLNVIVDCVIVYVVIGRVLSDQTLMRKFLFAFLLGGVSSGVYGWTRDDFTVDINVAGAGAEQVSRNFGALSDANFAGLLYGLCVVCTMIVKGIPLWLRGIFLALFVVMILQTASLSALLVLGVLGVFAIILKFRGRSVLLLLGMFMGAVILVTVLLSIPQVREIDAVRGLIIRISEKLSYIPRGRWDLLTTDRSAIWGEAIGIFGQKSLWGKLIGGSVITVMVIDYSVISIACHNSYLQSILNFGIVGTLLIYLPLFGQFFYRLCWHFTQKSDYDGEDIRMLQLIFTFAFMVFGMTVDFFIDWPYMMLYFI